ncbi:unnamed protein product [Acanthoscelides obtectus]|uniref:Uncharacterized protein n=1 Tax=Acanthoscelides obtectus TaxID=200917 RepID=A0A9P0KYL9_ACAOB|nr:unnamed protein product [Acanthoscelides obtectus]CAK1628237.1 hypothetical protein AOBTE_LOCUS5090 [Acanthoscelides obtectus]
MGDLLAYFHGEAHVVALDITKEFDQLWVADFLSDRKISEKLGYLFRDKSSLECCLHVWGAAAPTSLSMLDATLSHWRAVGDIALFYRYANGLCSSELSPTMPPRNVPAKQTRLTSRSGRYDRSFY